VSYAFSNYYEATSRAPASCDFAGNATINKRPDAPGSLSAAASAASACIAAAPAGGTFTPTASSSGPTTSGTSGSGSSGSSGKPNGAVSVVGPTNGWAGLGVSIGYVLAGAVWTVAA
jgi:1,3-beta-glucanosyltransferase GAS1